MSRRVGIFGATGTGKSYLARRLTKGHPRIIAFDAVEEARGGAARSSVADVRRLLIAHYDRGFNIVFRPKIAHAPAALSDLSEVLLGVARAGRGRHNVMLYAEELALSFPDKMLPRGQLGFSEICMIGRHYNISVVGVAQRIAQVSNIFTGNLDELYVFRPAEEADKQRARALLGRENDAAIRGLLNRDYLHRDHTTGRVTHHRHSHK